MNIDQKIELAYQSRLGALEGELLKVHVLLLDSRQKVAELQAELAAAKKPAKADAEA